MIVVRSLLFVVGQLVATVAIAPLVLLTIKFSLSKRYLFIQWWVDFNLWWLKVTCDLTYVVYGEEHIPNSGCVVMSNHQSAWETILLNRLFPGCAYVLKKELFRLPFFGWALSSLNQIPIDRSAGIRALDEVVQLGCASIANDRKVIIFPEGTRVPVDERPRFQAGASLLAIRAGSSVLPIAHDAGRYWPRHGFIKRPGTIQVHVGPLISSVGLKPRVLNTKVEGWIRAKQEEIDWATTT